MTGSLIDRIGVALYGFGWPQQIAGPLAIDERTARRWRSGDMTPPAGVWRDLGDLIGQRERDLAQLRLEAALEVARLAPQPVPGAG